MQVLKEFPPKGSLGLSRAASAGGKGHLSVLVVEDKRNAADVLGMYFESEGHETRVAYDGEEAVKMFMVEKPDLILMDLGMPGMNGLEAARHIRKLQGDHPLVVVAFSAFDEPEDILRCKEYGFDAHISKPAGPDELGEMMALVI